MNIKTSRELLRMEQTHSAWPQATIRRDTTDSKPAWGVRTDRDVSSGVHGLNLAVQNHTMSSGISSIDESASLVSQSEGLFCSTPAPHPCAIIYDKSSDKSSRGGPKEAKRRLATAEIVAWLLLLRSATYRLDRCPGMTLSVCSHRMWCICESPCDWSGFWHAS